MLAGSKRVWLTLLILIGGVIPIVHYWYYIGRVPSVRPLEARELLATSGSSVALIDVRSPEKFEDMHLEGAENWPRDEIMAIGSLDDISERFRGKTLLLVCDGGVSSAPAAQRLRRQFGVDAFNVRGGIQAWIASANKPGGVEVLFRSASGETLPPPFKESPWYEQLALFGAVLVIKPLYTLLSVVLIIVLWRLKSPDLVALRWAIIFFFIGEGFCALNILFFNHSSNLLEFIHSYGMALSFGFVTYAVLEALDLRIMRYSDPTRRCAALSLCRQCIKYAEVPCALKRMFYLVIPLLVILAFIPLLVGTNALSYNTEVFGFSHNYSHPVINQIFEIRYSPVYAMILLAASLLVLLLRKNDALALSRVLFAAGMGALGFAFLRLTFFGVYQDNLVWPNFWEELTELMYMIGVGFILWVFRRGLFPTGEGHRSDRCMDGKNQEARGLS